MKVLYFTKYSRKGASSRLRSFQYIPYLQEHGVKVSVSPLFNDLYLEKRYRSESVLLLSLRLYLQRFLALFRIFGYDCIIIEKELFPYFPAWAEFLLKSFKIEYIVDYDDAIFHNYDLNPNRLIRFLFKNKINRVMKWSCCVIVGNEYLRNKAQLAKAKKIEFIPTVINLEKYKKKEYITTNEPITIGWIGSKSTFKYLKNIQIILDQLVEKHNVQIHIVGVSESLNLHKNEQHINWSEETEVSSILNFDIGVMPLTDTPWEKGKCGYKLIQYMGCGIPVVASPVGMNNDIVEDGISGFLAKNDSDWYNYLEKYILNPELRAEHGKNGRKIVEKKYCTRITESEVLQIIQPNILKNILQF